MEKLRNIVGRFIVGIGFLVLVCGAVGITLYLIYDLIINWNSLTSGEVFWEFVSILCKDFFVIVVGLLIILVGYFVETFDRNLKSPKPITNNKDKL